MDEPKESGVSRHALAVVFESIGILQSAGQDDSSNFDECFEVAKAVVCVSFGGRSKHGWYLEGVPHGMSSEASDYFGHHAHQQVQAEGSAPAKSNNRIWREEGRHSVALRRRQDPSIHAAAAPRHDDPWHYQRQNSTVYKETLSQL